VNRIYYGRKYLEDHVVPHTGKVNLQSPSYK